ncbi:hypothetical protein AA18890_2752 [Komagataeibacter europaeus LMG 18890]|nr:hypothetical protein AA18890_2752 [Komagataeibacter europaeus LMG 18890]
MKKRVLIGLPVLLALAGCGEQTDPRLHLEPANEVHLDLNPGRIRAANLYGTTPPVTPVVTSPTIPATGVTQPSPSLSPQECKS